MTWLDRILWPMLRAGGDAAYVLFLVILPLLMALVSAEVGSRGLVVTSAIALAFIDFVVSDSRLRLRVWQATCDQSSLKRSVGPVVHMDLSRSKPSDWDET